MDHPAREVTVPAAAFDHLRAALVAQAGEEAGIQALHTAGFATGETFYARFAREAGGGVAGLSMEAFVGRLAEFFRERGWGSLEHEAAHPGVSILASGDWAEADVATAPHPTCGFTSGMLSYLLSRVAGGPVAVLETACRARGDARCAFAIGSEATIQRLYGALLEGHPLDGALERL